VDDAVRAAAEASALLEELGRERRARLLEAIADAVEENRGNLASTASREIGFSTAKLDAELTRAAFQFRFFGEVLREGT
jgi:NADP-dependent aldehyde dehydrogenase